MSTNLSGGFSLLEGWGRVPPWAEILLIPATQPSHPLHPTSKKVKKKKKMLVDSPHQMFISDQQPKVLFSH